MRTDGNRIDLHYHIIPKPYVDALRERGITGSTWGRILEDLSLKRNGSER